MIKKRETFTLPRYKDRKGSRASVSHRKTASFPALPCTAACKNFGRALVSRSRPLGRRGCVPLSPDLSESIRKPMIMTGKDLIR